MSVKSKTKVSQAPPEEMALLQYVTNLIFYAVDLPNNMVSIQSTHSTEGKVR